MYRPNRIGPYYWYQTDVSQFDVLAKSGAGEHFNMNTVYPILPATTQYEERAVLDIIQSGADVVANAYGMHSFAVPLTPQTRKRMVYTLSGAVFPQANANTGWSVIPWIAKANSATLSASYAAQVNGCDKMHFIDPIHGNRRS